MELESVIRKRESVRKFSDKKVSHEDIIKILEIANLAPTAKNIQPQVIYVLESEESIQKINECSPCIYGAKTVLLVCTNKEISFHKENGFGYEIDPSIVSTHILLEATNLGIDNIWIEMFDSNKVKETFNLDENIIPICLIPLGYRDESYKGSINHNKRKNINEYVTFI